MRIRDNLFAAICCGMNQETADIELSAEDCSRLLEISIRHSILPIVYGGIKRMSVPTESLNRFDREWIKNVFWHSQRQDALGKITSALEKAEIPYVP